MRRAKDVVPRHRHRYVMVASLVGAIACGRTADDGPATPQDEPVTVESSPWLVTAEIPPTAAGPLHAQRFEDGMLERVFLDAAVVSLPSWSPSASWLAYVTAAGDRRSVWMRRLEGDVWREAQLVTTAGSIGSMSWSPRSDLLLFEDRRVGGGVRLATPKEDGSLDVVSLSETSRTDERTDVEWSLAGDRIAITIDAKDGPRVFIHDVSAIVAGQTSSSRELVTPSGTTIDRVEPRLSSGRAVGLSADGRWMSAIVKGPDSLPDASNSVVAFSTSGESAPREMTHCPAYGSTTDEWCVPWSWHPEGAMLLVQRRRRGGSEVVLEAWSPDTGTHAVIGNVDPGGWLAPRSTRLLTARGMTLGLSIVDVRDVSAPVIAAVPTSELPSFLRATPSPDGRWLVLAHQDRATETSWLEAVDLQGSPPWNHREILRTDAKIVGAQPTWSPSSAYVMVDEDTGLSHRKRGIRIEVATGAVSRIEYVLGPVPSNHRWSWRAGWRPTIGRWCSAAIARSLSCRRRAGRWHRGSPTHRNGHNSHGGRPMRREVRFLSLSFLISSLAACGGVAGDASEAKADAEVVGTVKLREGDCMPVTTPERCRIRGLATRVEAYRVLRVEEGATGVSFVVPPNAKPVRTTTSGEDGRFSLVLPEGRYSILASYEGSWYPTAETGDGEWAPVEVNAGWQEDVELLINRATD